MRVDVLAIPEVDAITSTEATTGSAATTPAGDPVHAKENFEDPKLRKGERNFRSANRHRPQNYPEIARVVGY